MFYINIVIPPPYLNLKSYIIISVFMLMLFLIRLSWYVTINKVHYTCYRRRPLSHSKSVQEIKDWIKSLQLHLFIFYLSIVLVILSKPNWYFVHSTSGFLKSAKPFYILSFLKRSVFACSNFSLFSFLILSFLLT